MSLYKKIAQVVCVMLSVFSLLSCSGYQLSQKVEKLPGNSQSVYIPMFKNLTQEPGVEVYFSQALKKELNTNGKLQLKNRKEEAETFVLGEIKSLVIKSDESVADSSQSTYLPKGTVISTVTKMTVTVGVSLYDVKSNKLLWQSEFKQERSYTPPQVTLPVINSVNNLYNLTAQGQTLQTLANEMMQLAFDRMVDQF